MPSAKNPLRLLAQQTIKFITTQKTAPLFIQDFWPDAQTVLLVVSDNQMVFTPGVLRMLVRSTPPTAEGFLDLPQLDNYRKHWGLYVVVLRKGSSVLVYCGSSTNSKGMQERLNEYRKQVTLPSLIKEALKNDYEIIGFRVIAHMPVPKAAKYWRTKAFILLMEAVFSYSFWMISDRGKQMYLRPMSLWPFELYEFQGAVTHNSANEIHIIAKQLALTTEQVQAELDRRSQHLLEYRRARYQRIFRDPITGRAAQKRKYQMAKLTPHFRANHARRGVKTVPCNRGDQYFRTYQRRDNHYKARSYKFACPLRCCHSYGRKETLVHHMWKEHGRGLATPGTAEASRELADRFLLKSKSKHQCPVTTCPLGFGTPKLLTYHRKQKGH